MPTSAKCGGEQWNHDFMVPDDRIATAGAGGRTSHDVRLGTIVADEIEIHSREPGERNASIVRERDRLQKDLRQHDGRSAVQIDAAFQPGDIRNEVAEITETAFTNRGP